MESEPKISFENTEVAFSYKSDAALRKANFIFSLVSHPWVSAMATGAVKVGLALRLPIKGLIKTTAFDHFCGGETIDTCEPLAEQLAKHGVNTILDYSVEGEKSEVGFDAATAEILRTVEKAKQNNHLSFCVFKTTGLASTELLEKIQRKEILSSADQEAFDRVRNRIDRICGEAAMHGIPVLIDAEETWIQDPIDALALEMMQKYNQKKAIVFNTYQLYRKEALGNLRKHFHEAVMHNIYFGAKLVRGAYMEKERERAAKMNYPSPIHDTKEDTDNAFNQALAFCIDNKQRISVMCGSHNDYSNYYLTVLMEKHGMRESDERVWFAQLLGMSDHISFNLAKAGYHVAKYMPYGPVLKVMPYLLRRAEENTSVAGQSGRELSLIRTELKRRKETT